MTITKTECGYCEEPINVDIKLSDVLEYLAQADEGELEQIIVMAQTNLTGESTLLDRLKSEVLIAAANKYTLEELENRLK